MNCDECVRRLDAYVDRELTPGELVEVKRHLDDCPPCEDVFHLRSDLKRLVRTCCGESKAPVELREKLRQILF